MDFVNVSSQAELEAAVSNGDIPVCRNGFFQASGSATVRAFDSATVRAFDSATVEAFGSATVEAFGSATVQASGSATVRAFGSATVEAFGSATVEAFDSATVRASGSATVEASGSATVEAFGSATVEAFGSATVRASGSATVRASDSATVEAFDSATVRASDSATVRASDSATVRASDSATVRAFGSATVEASKFVAVTRHGDAAKVNGGVLIQIPEITDAQAFADFYGLDVDGGHVILYKLINDDYVSAHGASYRPGETTTAPDWDPHVGCGNGLHFSPRPFMARKYSNGSRFVACRVKLSEIVVITGGRVADKCKAPSCETLFECDADGVELPATAEVTR